MMPDKKESGFTLLEVVLAMLIIGIIAVPLFGLFSGSRMRYDRSTETTIAVNLAQQKMEEIIRTDIDTFVANPDSWKEFTESPGYFYQVDVIPPVMGSEIEKYKLDLYIINVRVSYHTGGRNHDLSLSTYLADW